MGDEKTCQIDAHKKHMCALQAEGATAEIERLSVNPTYECGVCGAKASCVDNICTPVKLFEDGQID